MDGAAHSEKGTETKKLPYRCTECGSKMVRKKYIREKGIVEYSCLTCGHTWQETVFEDDSEES